MVATAKAPLQRRTECPHDLPAACPPHRPIAYESKPVDGSMCHDRSTSDVPNFYRFLLSGFIDSGLLSIFSQNDRS